MLTWIYLNSVCALYEGTLNTFVRFLHKILLVHFFFPLLIFHVDLSNTLVLFSHSSVCGLTIFPLLENAALDCPVKLQYLQFLFLTEMEFNILHCIGFFYT